MSYNKLLATGIFAATLVGCGGDVNIAPSNETSVNSNHQYHQPNC